MADESYGFTQARTRLEEIVSAVRKKDTTLEKSLDLLEEGVRLANQCTELIDHADWEAAGTGMPIVPDAEEASVATDGAAAGEAGGDDATESAAVIDDGTPDPEQGDASEDVQDLPKDGESGTT